MGREIKFRALHKGSWVFFTIDDLLQFTGLHDKNGKEIWEGDLLQTTHAVRYGTSVCGRGRNQTTYAKEREVTEAGVLEYVNGEWKVKFNSFDDYDSYFFVMSAKDRPQHRHDQRIEGLVHRGPEHYEVIGNIYENPELLEAK
jgi:uncharacterized phage protein (TIGR01671 family)